NRNPVPLAAARLLVRLDGHGENTSTPKLQPRKCPCERARSSTAFAREGGTNLAREFVGQLSRQFSVSWSRRNDVQRIRRAPSGDMYGQRCRNLFQARQCCG